MPKNIRLANRKSANYHTCGRSASITNCVSPQICRFAIRGTYLRTVHLCLVHIYNCRCWTYLTPSRGSVVFSSQRIYTPLTFLDCFSYHVHCPLGIASVPYQLFIFCTSLTFKSVSLDEVHQDVRS